MLKKYFLCIIILNLTSQLPLLCSDKRKSTLIWTNDESLNSKLENFFSNKKLSKEKPIEIIDINNSVQGNILLLHKVTVPSWPGETSNITITEYTPQSMLTGIIINPHTSINQKNTSLLNKENVLIRGSNAQESKQSESQSCIYEVKDGWTESFLEKSKNQPKIIPFNANINGNYPSHYWICSNNSCQVYEGLTPTPFVENNSQEYVPEIANQQLFIPKTVDWCIKDNIITLFTEKINDATKNKEVEPDSFESENNDNNIELKNVTQLLPYSDTEAVALQSLNQNKKHILHIKLDRDTDSKKYSITQLECTDNPLKLAIGHADKDTRYIYMLTDQPSIKKASIKNLIDNAQKPKKGSAKETSKEVEQQSKQKKATHVTNPPSPLPPTTNQALLLQSSSTDVPQSKPIAATNTDTHAPTTTASNSPLATTTSTNANSSSATPPIETASSTEGVKNDPPTVTAKNTQKSRAKIFIPDKLHESIDDPEEYPNSLAHFRKMKEYAYLEPENAPKNMVYVPAKKWLLKEKSINLGTFIQQNKNDIYESTDNDILFKPYRKNTDAMKKADYWSKFKYAILNPKASVSNSWSVIKNYFMGIWSRTKVYGG